MTGEDDGETDQLRAHCYYTKCDKTFDSVNDMVPVAGKGDRSPRHFCEACAERIRRGPPLTDGGVDQHGDESHQKLTLHEAEVSTNPELSAEEKETSLTVDNAGDTVRIYSDIPTHIRWVLSITDADIANTQVVEGDIVGITADVPKGYIKLQGSNRQSQTNGSMVSYGPHK